MALDLGTLAAKLKLEDAEFQATLKKAPKDAEAAGKKVGDAVAKGVKPGASKTSSMLEGIGKSIALGAALMMAREAVNTFAELQDATAAAGVVFGDSMSAIQQAANGASVSLGMSKQQYIDAAITMGTFGKSAGLAGKDLSGFANQMTSLAGDMASFRGTTPDDAIEAVGAALRGEMEPIRRYGVLLDDATLRQQALSMGLIKTTKDALSPQVKVLAAQAAILKQTKDAQGDFARTSESTANVQKTLTAETANAAAAFGEKLAPTLVMVQKAGIGVLRWATDNQAALIPLVGTLGAVASVLVAVVMAGKGVEALKTAAATVRGLGAAFDAMSTKAKVATASAGGIGLALVAAAAIYGTFAQRQADATAAVEDYTAALEADNGALGENVRLTVAKRLEDSGALKAAQSLGISLSTVTDAVLGQNGAYETLQAKLRAGTQASDANATAAVVRLEAEKKLSDVLGIENSDLNNATAAEKRKSEAVGAGTTATKSNTTATDANNTSLKANAEKLMAVFNARLKLRGDQVALEAAIDGATKSLWDSAGVTDKMIDKHGRLTAKGAELVKAYRESGKALDINTEKGRANRTALDAIANAGLAVGGDMTRAHDAFAKTAHQMGLSATAADKLARKLGLIPKKVTTTIDVHKTGVSSITLAAPGGKAGGNRLSVIARASGGPVRRNGMYLVGELGPELVKFDADGHVYNNRQTQQMLSGGASRGGVSQFVQVDVHVPINPDVMGAGRQLEDLLNQYKGLANKTSLSFVGAPA